MKKKIVLLRNATLEDSKLVWRIRNLPEVRAVSIHQDFTPYKLFKENYLDCWNNYRIIMYNGKDIGYIRKEGGYIGIAMLKSYRNKGIGRQLLEEENGRAIILFHNLQSLNCFLKAGWRLKGFYLEK